MKRRVIVTRGAHLGKFLPIRGALSRIPAFSTAGLNGACFRTGIQKATALFLFLWRSFLGHRRKKNVGVEILGGFNCVAPHCIVVASMRRPTPQI